VKRFRFRLDQVLRVRRIQEERAQAALLLANRGARDAAARVEAALAEYETRSFPEGVQPYEEFERALFLLDTAASTVELSRRAHRDALLVVDERRREWMDARRRVQALERLEDRRRAEHELDNRRAEDRLVDDMIVARHAGGSR
jgi:flagellar export protein FliJ